MPEVGSISPDMIFMKDAERLGVRLSMARGGAQVELQLGERAKFFPTDAALASWMAQAEAGKAAVVYE